jgi:hypothetical protein
MAISSEETSLERLEQDFLLQRNDDRNFFLEWQQGLPTLTESNRENLQRIVGNVGKLLYFS